MKKIGVAICGYGNLGKGVEKALFNPANRDMELVAVFTRRDPAEISTASGVEVISVDRIQEYQDEIDVVILCSSAKDLLEQGPEIARSFNTVDSFDMYAKIPEYFAGMREASLISKKTSIVMVGWEPGICAFVRAYARAILPTGNHEQFVECVKGFFDFESNPEYTYNLLIAYARAAYYLNQNGEFGTKMIFDVPLSLLIAAVCDLQEIKELLND